MILYHGSNTEIKHIDLNMCRPYKDFGQGFYLTTIKGQAVKMAKRVSRIYGGIPIISVYEYNESDLKGLQIRGFDNPTEEWAKFVLNNRNKKYKDFSSLECNHDNKYDIVIGPIANDDLVLLFRQFSSGLIDIEILIKEMKYKKLTNQYSFHSNEAISTLKWVGDEYE